MLPITSAPLELVSVSSNWEFAFTSTDSDTAPTSRMASTGRVSLARNSTASRIRRLKPAASKVTRYGPGCSDCTRNSPSALVDAVNWKFVPVLTTTTETLGTTAPEASVTRPVIVDVPIWPKAAVLHSRNASAKRFISPPDPEQPIHSTGRKEITQF